MINQMNAKEVKEKILKYLSEKGPVLPVNVAKHIGLNSLFASAFLSELSSEKFVKISDMKVGGSPLYYLPSKINMLENFINSLNGREKEACLLLKEKGILEDVNQHPVIRVALRALKDFAIPFKKDNQVFWRYFTFSEESVREKIEGPIEIKKHEIEAPKAEEAESALKKQIEEKNNERTELDKIRQELELERNELKKLKKQIEEKNNETKENIKEKETKEKQKVKIKLKPLADEKFLNEIKGILERKKIELLAIESFDRKQVFAKVKLNNQDHFFAAYDKKRIDDEDLFKAYKKAQILGLPYSILAKGDTSKKTKEAIDAYKKLASIEKIENSDNLEQ